MSFRNSAFTLVEIIIALTILIIIAAAAIPTFKGFRDEQAAREPVVELTRLAKEARLRAMREKRPYQIAFHAGGFTASRYLSPYLQLSGLTEFLLEVEQKELAPPEEEELSNEANQSRPDDTEQVIHTKTADGGKFSEWTEDYKLPPNTTYTLQFWHELEALPVDGEVVKLWVFQPTGICQPLKVKLQYDTATFAIEYGALTADIVKESVDRP